MFRQQLPKPLSTTLCHREWTGTLHPGKLKSWKVVNSVVSSGDKSVYDVQRNYFYSIGTKNLSATTDGGTSDPGTTGDDDQPIDLSQETVITVTVNDAWDVIYNLGLEKLIRALDI